MRHCLREPTFSHFSRTSTDRHMTTANTHPSECRASKNCSNSPKGSVLGDLVEPEVTTENYTKIEGSSS